MTDQEINIAIAEACGWSEIDRYIGQEKMPEGLLKGQNPKYKGGKKEELPDYLNDLNAMHEAENSLLFSKRQEFQRQLQKVLSRGMNGVCLIAALECVHATARQRAEAFLRATKKWKE